MGDQDGGIEPPTWLVSLSADIYAGTHRYALGLTFRVRMRKTGKTGNPLRRSLQTIRTEIIVNMGKTIHLRTI